MSLDTVESRKLEPGTSGWTASDLDDPAIAAQWDAGQFEIINGVLKTMPAADFSHGEAVIELLTTTRDHLRRQGHRARISTEVDLIVSEDDVLRVDGMLITDREEAEQQRVLVQLKRPAGRLGRIRVAPALVIESVSAGHERHDRLTKSRLSAGFGIPNYWLVDTMRQTLDCMALDGEAYREDVRGRVHDVLRPTAFPGLEIRCAALWGSEAQTA